MVWTTPATFADTNTLTAAELNTFLRDNMLETMPAKATGPLQHFVTTGANLIAARDIASALVDTLETTTSTSFVDLVTVGPTVTATTGTQAIVMFAATMENTSTTDTCAGLVTVAVSGATTTAAADSNALRLLTASFGSSEKGAVSATMAGVYTLTAGSNTFTLKYRVTTGTGKFSRRQLVVMAL